MLKVAGGTLSANGTAIPHLKIVCDFHFRDSPPNLSTITCNQRLSYQPIPPLRSYDCCSIQKPILRNNCHSDCLTTRDSRQNGAQTQASRAEAPAQDRLLHIQARQQSPRQARPPALHDPEPRRLPQVQPTLRRKSLMSFITTLSTC